MIRGKSVTFVPGVDCRGSSGVPMEATAAAPRWNLRRPTNSVLSADGGQGPATPPLAEIAVFQLVCAEHGDRSSCLPGRSSTRLRSLGRRLIRRRLTTILGRRAASAAVTSWSSGFGQVGTRLSQTLRNRGVLMIAVERNPDAPSVRLAPKAGIPVVIGGGDDRATRELVGVRRCAAVAAVTSDDLVNVAVGLAASDVKPGVPLSLRLDDGGVAAGAESLLQHLGRISDAHHHSATTPAEAICAVVLDHKLKPRTPPCGVPPARRCHLETT